MLARETVHKWLHKSTGSKIENQSKCDGNRKSWQSFSVNGQQQQSKTQTLENQCRFLVLSCLLQSQVITPITVNIAMVTGYNNNINQNDDNNDKLHIYYPNISLKMNK